MKRLVCVEGRLAWPFVSAVIFLTVSFIAFDYFWRVLIMPFETFLILAVLVDGVAALAAIGLYRLFRARKIRAQN